MKKNSLADKNDLKQLCSAKGLVFRENMAKQ